jgi:heme oxygenase
MLNSLLKKDLSLLDYCRVLHHYALAYESLEADLRTLEMTLCLGRVVAYTPRLPALAHDLDRLAQWGAIPPRVLAPDQRRCRLKTNWQYWGARYVLEGAAQGSKVIALQLRKHLPQLMPDAFAFWNLQLRLAQDWSVVCERLAQSAPTAAARQQILDGADLVFYTFISCFDSMDVDGEIRA